MHSCEHVKQSLFLRYSIIVLFPYDVSRSLLAARISEYVHYTIKFFSGKTHSTRNYWTNIVERLGKFSLFFLFLKWCSHLLWKSKEGHVYIEWEKRSLFSLHSNWNVASLPTSGPTHNTGASAVAAMPLTETPGTSRARHSYFKIFRLTIPPQCLLDQGLDLELKECTKKRITSSKPVLSALVTAFRCIWLLWHTCALPPCALVHTTQMECRHHWPAGGVTQAELRTGD